MFMAFMSLVIVASVPLCGGRLGLLADVRVRLTWLILAALVVQVVITDVTPGAPRALLVSAHLATYVVAGVVVWVNRSLPGLLVLGVGALLNAVTIALNGGTLPASSGALAAAGLPVDTSEFANSGAMKHPLLGFLGDTMVTPPWLPFRNVISIGDLIILAGAVVLLHAVTRTRPAVVFARQRTVGRHRASSATGVALTR
jgi:hypothetical protein